MRQAAPQDMWFEEESQVIVIAVRAKSRARRRCGLCGTRSPGFDTGAGRRRWRHLDAAGLKLFLEADAPRVRCKRHGVVVAAVPWARHDAGHTYDFDQQVTWMATECSKAATAQLMRTAWRTVGAIITRYKDPLRGFFDTLGEDRSHKLTHISADGAERIADVVAERAPNAVRAMDPFHVVAWATDAPDEERRAAWNRARREAADPEPARKLKHSRHALWQNPGDLTPRQRARLGWIAANDPRLYRAYLLKEGLRTIYQIARTQGTDAAVAALDRWLAWAARSRILAFVDLGRRIRRHYDAILHAVVEQLSNGLIESTNTKNVLLLPPSRPRPSLPHSPLTPGTAVRPRRTTVVGRLD